MVKVKPNKDNTEMITLPKYSKEGFYIDGYLKSNLDVVKKDVKKDYDAFIVVTGREGFGKSTLAGQVAKYLDPTYNLDRCVFTAEQFKEAVINSKPYQAIVFDETQGYLSSRGAMSKFNRTLIKIFSEMRSKNLFIILCISNFFELDRYPAIHRSTGLLYVYQRTKFGSYDYNQKKKLYLAGKRFYSYSVPPTFIGMYPRHFVYDKEKYEIKKQKAINEFEDEKNIEKKLRNQRDILIRKCVESKFMNVKEVSELIGIGIQWVYKIVA